MTDHDGNSDVEAVAVAPEARGRGISGNLLRHALVDARERGNETSTLMSTPLGLPVYERLGFRSLGRCVDVGVQAGRLIRPARRSPRT